MEERKQMIDRNKLIKAWEIFRDSNPYEICSGREFRAIKEPEYCMGQMIEDTLAILREQADMVLSVPEKCADCKSCQTMDLLTAQIAYCNMKAIDPVNSQQDISTTYIEDVNTRLESCPIVKLNESIESLSPEKREQFNKIAAGMTAFFGADSVWTAQK